MYNVTDANGKELSFTLDQLQDINYNFFDNSSRHQVSSTVDMKNFIVPIVDEKGNDIGKVGDISSVTDSEGNLPKSLLVTIEATHSGDNHNYAIYHSDSMEKDGASMVYPYNKPFIKNHDRETEPLGRIVDQQFKQSDICPDRDTLQIGVKVSDSDAISKFLDGRYKTVSIGASVGHIKCNICGKDILKDKKVKFCGHYKGQKYGDNMALWHLRDLNYNECSVVNSPADDWAQVIKVTVLSDSKSNDNKEEDNLVDNNVVENNIDTSTLEVIDNIIEQNDGLKVEGIENEELGDTDNVNDEISENESKILGLNDRISTLEQELEIKDQALIESQNAFDEINTKFEEVSIQHDEYRKVSISLANLNKTLLVDKIMLLSDGLKKLSDYNSKDQLLSLSAKELNSIIDSLESIIDKPRQIQTIENPGLVSNDDKHSINEDDEETKVVESKIENKRNHLDSIINSLCK